MSVTALTDSPDVDFIGGMLLLGWIGIYRLYFHRVSCVLFNRRAICHDVNIFGNELANLTAIQKALICCVVYASVLYKYE